MTMVNTLKKILNKNVEHGCVLNVDYRLEVINKVANKIAQKFLISAEYSIVPAGGVMITASVSVTVETSGPLHDGLLAAVAVGHPLTPARKQKQQLSHLISSTHCTQDHTLARLILAARVN